MRHAGFALVAALVFFAPAAAVVRADPPAVRAVPAQPDRLVLISVRVVEATPRAARSLRLLATTRRPGDVATFDPAALARRIDCWTRAGHVNALSAPRFMAVPGQTATAQVGEYVSYIEDLEIETSMGGPAIANPVLQTVFDGLHIECTADLVPGAVSLTAKLALSDVLRPIPEFETTLTPDTKVRIQLPEVNIRRVERRLVLAPGRAALLADLPPVASDRSGRIVMAWIEAHAVKADAVPEASAAK